MRQLWKDASYRRMPVIWQNTKLQIKITFLSPFVTALLISLLLPITMSTTPQKQFFLQRPSKIFIKLLNYFYYKKM